MSHFMDSVISKSETLLMIYRDKKGAGGFYHNRVVVYTNCQHTFMFKQHEHLFFIIGTL